MSYAISNYESIELSVSVRVQHKRLRICVLPGGLVCGLRMILWVLGNLFEVFLFIFVQFLANVSWTVGIVLLILEYFRANGFFEFEPVRRHMRKY